MKKLNSIMKSSGDRPMKTLLFLCAAGMTKGFAYDFSAVCPSGQTLYYNIIDATNHYVEITYPGSEDYLWEGYTKPTGNITLPSNFTYGGTIYTVKAIGRLAFAGCSGLTSSLTLPNSVTEIGYSAFYRCSCFTGSLTLPNSVTWIGNDAFNGCSGLVSFNIPDSVLAVGENPFKETGWYLQQPDGILYLDGWCLGYKGEKPTGTLVLNGNTKGIPNRAFYQCDGLTGSLTIPNSVTIIGNGSFQNCSGFTGSLTIPSSVTTIGQGAFEYCSGFAGSLTIGNSVTEIGDYAFYECSGFTEMTVLAETPPALGTYVFEEVPTTIPVYVPCESGADYQSASGWSAFSNIIDPCSGTVTQTVTLSAGWNNISVYLKIGDEDEAVAMLEQLEEALGENALTIEGTGGVTQYEDEEWYGSLDNVGVTNDQSYVILVSTACTIELQGMPADPAGHPITITPGWNYIGFPYSEEVDIEDALSEFEAEENDMIEGPGGYTTYEDEEWYGSLSTFVPGQGYKYFSNSSETKTLVFLTEASTDTHDYVDLGLSSGLLWATCNVGAENPEDYGDYFAWGETQLKDYYSYSTYQYCMGYMGSMTKYCNNSSYGYNGFVDNLTTLLPVDDAVTVYWGADWRMPTKEEWQELIDNTTTTWTTQNGVKGRLFTATNGNSIFLPAADCINGNSSSLNLGRCGYYWSRSLNTSNPNYAWSFYFSNSSNGFRTYSYYRSFGLTVRAVRSGNK